MFSKYSLNRLIVLYCAAGFLFLGIDSIIEHRDVLGKEWGSLIPVIFGFLMSGVCLITLKFWKDSFLRGLRIALCSAVIVSAVGTWFHIREEDDDEKPAAAQDAGQKEKDKPPLAPCSFAGCAAVGLLAVSKKRLSSES